MHMIPMGDYYVWHCDWSDSTNYTPWSRPAADDLACAACHQHTAFHGASSSGHNHLPAPNRRQHDFTGIAC